jgi:hypothetical protein
LTERLKKVHKKYEQEKPMLMFHQYMIREMFTDPIYGIGTPGNARGMLIYHDMGVGKTMLAVSVMLALLDIKQPVILVAKSLQQNFISTIDKLVDDPILSTRVKKSLNFVSMDAYNSADQMKTKSGNLNNKLLIVDEAHNFFKSIINSGGNETNARTLYEMIMGAYGLSILFLSGTPITKDPFELVPCMNMLTKAETLPLQYDTFYRHYITSDHKINNKNKLQNRLFGLVSFISFTKDVSLNPNINPETFQFPKNLGISVERVEMSEAQYLKYVTIRDKEDKDSIKKSTGTSLREHTTPALSLPSSSSKSSYHVESRQISNYAPNTGDFDKVSSAKIAHMMTVLKSRSMPVLIYSQFVKGGIDIIIKYLQQEGYEEWLPNRLNNKILKPAKRFAVIAGRVTTENRTIIQEMFNRGDNMYGDSIGVLLVSQTGAEGLDLKNVRQIHILEPYWDWARLKQIQARGIRKGSHLALPDTERDVKTYIYLSMPNKRIAKYTTFKEKNTIDERFLINAKRKNVLINEFLTALQEISVECVINNYSNCRLCIPNNEKLYTEKDTSADIDSKDPCQLNVNQKIEAMSVEHEGTTYYYNASKDSALGYKFYQYNEEMDGYAEIPQSDRMLTQLLKKIGLS